MRREIQYNSVHGISKYSTNSVNGDTSFDGKITFKKCSIKEDKIVSMHSNVVYGLKEEDDGKHKTK
jgi:hypothetical protein